MYETKKFLNKNLIKKVRLLDRKEEPSFIYTDTYIKRGMFNKYAIKVKKAWYSVDAINGKFPWMKFESYESYNTNDDLLDSNKGIIIDGNKAYLKPRLEIDMSEEEIIYIYFDTYDEAKCEYEKLFNELNAYEY